MGVLQRQMDRNFRQQQNFPTTQNLWVQLPQLTLTPVKVLCTPADRKHVTRTRSKLTKRSVPDYVVVNNYPATLSNQGWKIG